MLVSRRRLAALAAAGLLAAPAPALGQSAGDEQYQDPFAGEQQEPSPGGSGGGAAPTAPAAPEPAVPAQAETGQEPSPPTAESGPVAPAQPQLPNTGAE